MQINNTTNTHNKNLSFGKLYVDSESLAKLGSKFARELEAAKPELKKLYSGKKTDVFLKHGDSFGSHVMSRKDGVVKREQSVPQNFIQKLFREKPEKKIRYDQLAASSAYFKFNAETKKDEIINAVSTAVKEARGVFGK